MPKKRYTIADLRDVIDAGSIDLKFEDGEWVADADHDEPIGRLWPCPCETIGGALTDVGDVLQSKVAAILLSQLTHYQVAVMISALRCRRDGSPKWCSTQDIPTTVSPRSAEILHNDGILELSHQYKCGSWSTYVLPTGEDHSVRSSGFKLSAWGRAVLLELSGLAWVNHPKVQDALVRLRMIPVECDQTA